jgi:sec-independent protein translocase protein TatA
MHLPLANLFGIDNWIFIAFFGLLIFGRRLPEVGRSLGKGIVEFKKGLAGVEEEINQAGQGGSTSVYSSSQRASLPTGYKFDPYTGKPLIEEPKPQMRFDPYTGKPIEQPASTGGNG